MFDVGSCRILSESFAIFHGDFPRDWVDLLGECSESFLRMHEFS